MCPIISLQLSLKLLDGCYRHQDETAKKNLGQAINKNGMK